TDRCYLPSISSSGAFYQSHTSKQANTHTHTRTHTCTQIDTHTHTHKHTHTHMHTNRHTHTHEHTRPGLLGAISNSLWFPLRILLRVGRISGSGGKAYSS